MYALNLLRTADFFLVAQNQNMGTESFKHMIFQFPFRLYVTKESAPPTYSTCISV